MKEVFIELFRHPVPELESLVERMPIVKPRVNASPVGFRFQLADVGVCVSRVGGSAAHREFHIRRAKEILQCPGYRAGGTPMSSGEFRMGRGWCEREPSGISDGLRIPVYIAIWNCCYWTPETEVILGVKTTNT